MDIAIVLIITFNMAYGGLTGTTNIHIEGFENIAECLLGASELKNSLTDPEVTDFTATCVAETDA